MCLSLWSFHHIPRQRPTRNITTTIIQLKGFFFILLEKQYDFSISSSAYNLINCYLLQMSIYFRKIRQIVVQKAGSQAGCNHYLSDRQTDRGNSNYFMQSRLELGVTRIFLVWILHCKTLAQLAG